MNSKKLTYSLLIAVGLLTIPAVAIHAAVNWTTGTGLIWSDGKVGVGTSSPAGLLDVGDRTSGTTTAGHLVVDEVNDRVYVGRLANPGSNTSRFIVRNRLGSDLINVDLNSGTSYINTNLFVNGGILNFSSGGTSYFKVDNTGMFARKITVSNSWADYVFDDSYKLMSLGEVENFIKENKHLPNIPSAKEIEEKGIDVGDMQRLQMEKIEELTLYILELDERINKLENENKVLKEQLH